MTVWIHSLSPLQKSRKPDWDKVYRVHPILAHTKTPIKAPLLALPYGKPNLPREKYREYQNLHIEAVNTFTKLLSKEALADPIPTVQGILRSCFDLQDLRSEVGGAGGWGRLDGCVAHQGVCLVSCCCVNCSFRCFVS